jgi:hypothetical protein
VNVWNGNDARAIATPQEIQLVTTREDGSRRRPTTIWIVADGDRVFIRSTNGRSAAWFRGAIATGTGQVIAGGTAQDVQFAETTDEADLLTVDSAYRGKYGSYRSIVDHLLQPGPRAATLEIHPA